MTSLDTVKAITENLERVLEGLGIHFSREVSEDRDRIPASLLPSGQIFYRGETFEYTHGQRPGYALAGFVIRVYLRERDGASAVMEQQRWVHGIREALTVDALNTGDIAAAKPVSRVIISKVETENFKNLSAVLFEVQVRYREV